jgi:beta-xylosidase
VARADAIFGVTNPGGKLPFTLPRHVGQMPIRHAQKWGSGYRRTKDDIHHGYLDIPSTPLFAFGHGPSYTTRTLRRCVTYPQSELFRLGCPGMAC